MFLAFLFSLNIFAQTQNELRLLDLANQARAQVGIKPLVWNQKLYEAAKFHSNDLASHGGNCDLHDSCSGEKWSTRVSRYYPNWVALGENVAVSIDNPQVIHDGWMNSDGHRRNILNPAFLEMGAAISMGDTNFGKFAFATEDFGSRGFVPVPSPTPIPSPTPPADDELIVLPTTLMTQTVFKERISVSCRYGNICAPVKLILTKLSGPSNKKIIKKNFLTPKVVTFSFNRKAEAGSVFRVDIINSISFQFTVK